MVRLSVALLVVIVGLLCLQPADVHAQESSALINKALDEQITLDFPTNTPLPKVLESLTQQTGVPLKASDDLYDILPWGEQTGLAVTSKNQTLRDTLSAIAPRLGMTFASLDESIELRPMPALRRLGKRATLQELDVLNLLSDKPADIHGDRVQIGDVLQAIDKKLETLKSPFAVENRALDRVPASTKITVPRNATMLEALEAIPQYSDATWYPWGKTIVIVSKEDHVRNQLAKTISVRYNDAELITVLQELSKRAGVPFTMEPGALQQVPAEYRTVKLMFDNVTLQQALDNVSAITGLSYRVTEAGVHFSAAAANGESAKMAANSRDPVLAITKLPDGTELLLAASQIPEDVRQYLRFKTDQTIAQLRAKMAEEGFEPTTQPTTQATTKAADEDL